ncbi:hypothetical protein [Nocardia sp. CDC160]|uniref:hypothetical protein n=1 Tax=Nocardia sp. CDC160 TaxID=3112166 RepID=UPI002DBF95EC|nr:hypothetical protein [Nocardia sp. CDC160]MEC3913297.1 hypothetical protein [Nocardia sp. CDC160]
MSSPGAQQNNGGNVTGAATPVVAGNHQQPYPTGSAPYSTQQLQQGPPFNAGGFPQLQLARSRRSKWWAWGLGGALLASVVWAVGLFAVSTTGDDGKPWTDSGGARGYRYVDDFCKATDVTALRDAGYAASKPGIEHSATSPAMDAMSCQMLVTYGKQSSATGSITVSADIHNQVNPVIEFDAEKDAHVRTSFAEKIETKKIDGLGEDAYSRIETGKGQREIQVNVRDGGLILKISLSQSHPDVVTAPNTYSYSLAEDSAVEMLRQVASSTMAGLK